MLFIKRLIQKIILLNQMVNKSCESSVQFSIISALPIHTECGIRALKELSRNIIQPKYRRYTPKRGNARLPIIYRNSSGERMGRLEDFHFKGGKTPAIHNSKFQHGNVNWVTSKDMKSTYISSSILKITKDSLCEMELFPQQGRFYLLQGAEF